MFLCVPVSDRARKNAASNLLRSLIALGILVVIMPKMEIRTFLPAERQKCRGQETLSAKLLQFCTDSCASLMAFWNRLMISFASSRSVSKAHLAERQRA